MRAVHVLVVEDERAKRDEISNEIQSFFNGEVHIVHAETFGDASRQILAAQYDLIVADLLLPRRQGEAEADVSDELIEYIAASECNRLTTVVAISRFEDVVAQRRDDFARAGIFLIRYEDDWKHCLRICMQRVTFRTAYDFVIVCALEKERSAFEAATNDRFEYGNLVNYHGLDSREMRIGDYTGVCVVPPRMGLVDCSIITTRALNAFSPKLVCMSGICGGFKDEAPLGTLIVSDVTWEHQAGKWSSDGFDIRSFQEPINNNVRTILSQLIQTHRNMEGFKSKHYEVPVPLVGISIKPTTSGSAVIASQEFTDKIKQQNGKVAGIDMEVYGVYRAAALHGHVLCFAAKTVVDHADAAKDDSLHDGGAILSARFTVKAIEKILNCCQDGAEKLVG